MYENLVQTVNTAPSAPTTFQSEVTIYSATLSWNDGMDTETPTILLTYNLRVGSTPGGADIVYAELTEENSHPSFGRMWHAHSTTLTDLAVGTYYWSVQTVDTGFRRSVWAEEQSFEVTGSSVNREGMAYPLTYGLHPLYPNPFNPIALLEFSLPTASTVILRVYNTLGQEIATIADGGFSSGTHQVTWDGRDYFGHAASSGIYLFHLQSDLGISIQKGVLLH